VFEVGSFLKSFKREVFVKKLGVKREHPFDIKKDMPPIKNYVISGGPLQCL
jgi:hypothetical protein